MKHLKYECFQCHWCLKFIAVWITLLGSSQQGRVRSVQRAEVWNETLIDWENSRQHGERHNSTRAEVTGRQGCRRVNEEYAGGVRKDPGLASHPDPGSVCMAINMPWLCGEPELWNQGPSEQLQIYSCENVPFLNRHGSCNSANSENCSVHFHHRKGCSKSEKFC